MHGRTPFYDKNRKLMFYRIMNTEPSFPSSFSPESISCIRGFLRVDVDSRLGSRGATTIKATDFFKTINFAALYERQIKPPFSPDVVDETDTKYVPKGYLQADAKDSIDATSSKVKLKKNAFEGFTYAGEKALE